MVVQVDKDEAEEFAEVKARNHFLKGLLAGPWGVLVDDDIIRGAGKNDVLVIEGAVLAVDGDGHVGRQVQVRDLGDRAAVFHVGCVAASAEDAPDFHGVVRVRGGDESAGGIVDESTEFDGKFPPGERGLKHWRDVVTFNPGNIKPFRPPL